MRCRVTQAADIGGTDAKKPTSAGAGCAGKNGDAGGDFQRHHNCVPGQHDSASGLTSAMAVMAARAGAAAAPATGLSSSSFPSPPCSVPSLPPPPDSSDAARDASDAGYDISPLGSPALSVREPFGLCRTPDRSWSGYARAPSSAAAATASPRARYHERLETSVGHVFRSPPARQHSNPSGHRRTRL